MCGFVIRRGGVLTFGSGFSGIDGLGLGLERAGWVCKWQIEKDPYATAVLVDRWPGVPRHGDIRRTPLEKLEPVNAVVGGFPCQPTSVAGRRLGSADDRWLWPEFARLLSVLRPEWVLLENPTGLLAFREFGDILGDLARIGFDAEWDAVPAAAVGAPHERDRVFVVAHAARFQPRRPEQRPGRERIGTSRESVALADSGRSGRREGLGDVHEGQPDLAGSRTDVADPSGNGRGARRPGDAQEGAERREPDRSRGSSPLADSNGERELQPEGEQSDLRGRPGDPGWWFTEPNVGRVAHGVPSRVDRLRVLGNAVVPQVAEVWGRLILTAHNRGAA